MLLEKQVDVRSGIDGLVDTRTRVVVLRAADDKTAVLENVELLAHSEVDAEVQLI